ncbi:MAG: HEAT repeat domain-containing protein [Geminicoccaceae bacterium]
MYQDDADPQLLERAIRLTISDQLFEHEPRIRQLVEHPDPEVRGQVIRRMVGILDRQEMFQCGYQMMNEDSSVIARGHAVSAFSVWLRNDGVDHPCRAEVLSQMVRALKAALTINDEDAELLQRKLHRGLMTAITGKDCEEPIDFEPERDIDWDMLKLHFSECS